MTYFHFDIIVQGCSIVLLHQDDLVQEPFHEWQGHVCIEEVLPITDQSKMLTIIHLFWIFLNKKKIQDKER